MRLLWTPWRSRPLRRVMILVGVVASVTGAMAFPPAPPTTLYGAVRGEFGYKVDDGETDLVLLADGVEVGRTTIKDEGELGVNYRLLIPLDLNPSLGTYRPGTVSDEPSVVYQVRAERGSTQIPVSEVNYSLDAFVPGSGSLFNIDFVLGEDSDGDGLPDAWERYQVHSIPGYQGANALELLTRDGDFDGDGLSNLAEYIAGTFALLNGDALDFRIVEVGDDGRTSFEFFAVDGKTYIIEASDDAKHWERIYFETPDSATEAISVFRASGTKMESVHKLHSLAIPRKFYRLLVN